MRSSGSATPHAELTASRQIVWEQDPFARGGYAYFDPGFDPRAAGVAGETRRPIVLRRRAHQHQVAGVHERRGGKRTPGRRRSRRRPRADREQHAVVVSMSVVEQSVVE